MREGVQEGQFGRGSRRGNSRGQRLHAPTARRTGGATPRFWTPTTPPTDCWPEAPWGGGGGGEAGRGDSGRGPGGAAREGGSLGGGGGCRAPPNSWAVGHAAQL